jgi:hypothetical protein
VHECNHQSPNCALVISRANADVRRKVTVQQEQNETTQTYSLPLSRMGKHVQNGTTRTYSIPLLRMGSTCACRTGQYGTYSTSVSETGTRTQLLFQKREHVQVTGVPDEFRLEEALVGNGDSIVKGSAVEQKQRLTCQRVVSVPTGPKMRVLDTQHRRSGCTGAVPNKLQHLQPT